MFYCYHQETYPEKKSCNHCWSALPMPYTTSRKQGLSYYWETVTVLSDVKPCHWLWIFWAIRLFLRAMINTTFKSFYGWWFGNLSALDSHNVSLFTYMVPIFIEMNRALLVLDSWNNGRTKHICKVHHSALLNMLVFKSRCMAVARPYCCFILGPLNIIVRACICFEVLVYLFVVGINS